MDSQVKERIVGAAVLVALAVWLIPWVLDGPEPAAPEPESDPALELESQEQAAPVRTETVELTAGAPTRRSEADVVAGRSETVTLATPAPDPAPSGDIAGTAEAETEPASQPVAAAAPPSGDWVVQLGAFREVANAEQLASRVSTFGYQAYVSEFRSGGQLMYRVRVGGFASENEAEAALSALSAHQFPGRVTAAE